MSKLRVALVVLGDVMLFIVLALLFQLDHLVNGTLYNHGLVFSDEWAQPYWLLLRVCFALIMAAILLISVVELPHPIFEDD
jgi:hypothetical protein